MRILNLSNLSTRLFSQISFTSMGSTQEKKSIRLSSNICLRTLKVQLKKKNRSRGAKFLVKKRQILFLVRFSVMKKIPRLYLWKSYRIQSTFMRLLLRGLPLITHLGTHKIFLLFLQKINLVLHCQKNIRNSFTQIFQLLNCRS